LKNLKNIIKIADIVSKGGMSFEQHSKFVKKGLRTYEEQCSELKKIQREKERKGEIKGEMLMKNNKKISRKFKAIKKMNCLGKKRNSYNTSMTKDLICSIDEFIFHKREVKLINGYDSYFKEMEKKISESLPNANGLNVRQIKLI
jgi:hypothetical protein